MTEPQPKYCPECKNELSVKEGVSSKTGKPYKGWNCDNCKKIVEWINEKKSYAKPKPLIDDQQYQTLLTANRELYLILKIIAFHSGITERDLQKDLEKLRQK